jgi:Lon-like ATP-dependent protease
VAPAKLRWRCTPDQFPFQTTEDLGAGPINIIGQGRALEALRLGLSVPSDGYNIFVTGDVGSGRSTVVRRTLGELERGQTPPADLVFVHNFQDNDQPRRLTFPAGRGKAFRDTMDELIESLIRDLPKLFDSEEYRKHRTVMIKSSRRRCRSKVSPWSRCRWDR